MKKYDGRTKVGAIKRNTYYEITFGIYKGGDFNNSPTYKKAIFIYRSSNKLEITDLEGNTILRKRFPYKNAVLLFSEEFDRSGSPFSPFYYLDLGFEYTEGFGKELF